MSPAVVELASGVDALYLSGRAALPGGLLVRLKMGREAAERDNISVQCDFGGEVFEFLPHAFGKYRYCLRHRNGQLGISPSEKIPAFRIQPRAEFLHGVGPSSAVAWFADVIESEVGALRLSVSRADLFADVQGWSLCGDDRSRFLCRADKLDTHESGEVFNGLSFGRRASQTMTARIYDKTIESKERGTDYWPDIWGAAYDPILPVLRIEFEFLRSALRQFGLDAPADVLDATGALWASATDWLSYRIPTDDLTHSRWPIAPEWQTIQRASIREDAAGLERVYRGKTAGSLRRMLPQLNGWVVSYAALIGSADIEETCSKLAKTLKNYAFQSERSFKNRVTTRQREMS